MCRLRRSRALVGEPPPLLLMQRLAREQGCTILLVTHDSRILDIADRTLSLEDGRLC